MSRYLLDTNTISRRDEELFISSLAVAEIRRGLLEKPAGKKRRELERWFYGPEGPQELFAGRVLHFDERAASSGRS